MKLKQYSDKSIVITCDDNGSESFEKDIEYLTGIGGKFNNFLKGGGGWIFPNYRRKEIENYMEKSATRDPCLLQRSGTRSGPSSSQISSEDDAGIVCVSENTKKCNCIVYINMLTEKLELAYLKIKKIEEEILNIKKNKSQKYTSKQVWCEDDFISDAASDQNGVDNEIDKQVRKRLLR